MSWVPRLVGPLFRALRFIRTSRGIRTVPRRVARIRSMRYPVKKPTKIVKRHVKKKMLVKSIMAYRSRPRRRFRRRRFGKKKIMNKIHRYIRWCDKDTQYPGSTGPSEIVETGANQHLAYSFKLDNLTTPSDFTNLYDMYRINKVTLYLESYWDQTGSIGAANPQNRRLLVVHDYNDNNVLTDEDEYLQYSNCKRYSAIRSSPIAITLYPKINNVVENVGGSANAFTSMSSNKVWLNIVDDEVPHFGVKIMIPRNIAGAESTILFRVRAKFDVSFKNSK